jgi:hypothetical protein
LNKSFSLVIARIGTLLPNLFMTAVVVNKLGIEARGTIAAISSCCLFLPLLTGLGSSIYVRKIFSDEMCLNPFPAILKLTLLSAPIHAVIAMLLNLTIFKSLPLEIRVEIVFVITASSMVTYWTSIQSFKMYLGKQLIVATSLLAPSLVSMIMFIGIAYFDMMNLFNVILINLIGSTVPLAILRLKHHQLEKLDYKVISLGSFIRKSWTTGTAQLTEISANKMDDFLIFAILGPSISGIYSVFSALSRVFLAVAYWLNALFLSNNSLTRNPFFQSRDKNPTIIASIMSAIVYVTATAVYMIWFVNIAVEGFYPILLFFGCMTGLLVANSVYGMQLMLQGKPLKYLLSNLFFLFPLVCARLICVNLSLLQVVIILSLGSLLTNCMIRYFLGIRTTLFGPTSTFKVQ